MPEYKPILCLDFDGVLHSYESGWIAADKCPDPPVDGAKQAVEAYLEAFEVHIYSSRSHQEGGIGAMIDWCAEHFGEAITKKLVFPGFKPSAMITLDDRGWRFNGRWPAVNDLLRFKPWNRR